MFTMTNNNGAEIIIDENQISEMINDGVAELLNKIAAITGGPNPESLTWEQYKEIDALLWDAYISLKDMLFNMCSFDEAAKLSDKIWSEYTEIKSQIFSLVKVSA